MHGFEISTQTWVCVLMWGKLVTVVPGYNLIQKAQFEVNLSEWVVVSINSAVIETQSMSSIDDL